MFEGAGIGIVESEAGRPEAAHDFSGIGPEGVVSNLVDVLFVVVSAEHGVIGLGFREASGDIGVVVQGYLSAGNFEFGELSVEGYVVMFGGDGAEEEGVPVVVAEDGIDGAGGESFGEGGEGKGGAEIPEEEDVFRLIFGYEG